METSFDPETHSYFIDGKRATGVTSIIGVLAKPALIQWAANEVVKKVKEIGLKSLDATPAWTVTEEDLEEARTAHTKKKEAAGTHGTDTHALVETYVNQCFVNYHDKPYLPEENSEAARAYYEPIRPFIEWALENVDHFLFSERRMFNKELFIAGTADFAYIGKDGKKYMADFKTSSGIYGIDYWLQVAAYRFLAEAEGDTPYDGATVVRMGKDGSFEVQHRFDYETDKEAFLACLTLYRAQATYTKPNK